MFFNEKCGKCHTFFVYYKRILYFCMECKNIKLIILILSTYIILMNNWLSKTLRKLADDVDAGNTNASEEELIEICDMIGFVTNPESKLSKYQAIKFLGISRATFDNYVAKGLIPKGMEQQGFKEKFWYKRDLVKFKETKDG